MTDRTNLIEVGRAAPGTKADETYLVQLKDDVNMSNFLQRFSKACPPGPGSRITREWPYLMGFSGIFSDETLHFLRSSPEVDYIDEPETPQEGGHAKTGIGVYHGVYRFKLAKRHRNPNERLENWSTLDVRILMCQNCITVALGGHYERLYKASLEPNDFEHCLSNYTEAARSYAPSPEEQIQWFPKSRNCT
ncbi:hypothetical protein D9611_004267 [Ephemerocybe angulata]|uniref:Uncharacterized protein n=1 Tax=Ephemerocybe angulata TaxID=980116 RepID=A0A8H5BL95_9AGAR|nr:hypothetical protein D9611_004267 [Tulosesus angulatus]